MFTGPVNSVERLLLEKSSKSVLGGNLLDHLHNDKILVDLDIVDSEVRRELKLGRSNLAVASFERDTHLEALVLNLLHAPKSGSGG